MGAEIQTHNFIDDIFRHVARHPARAAIVLDTGRSINWRQLGEGIANARLNLKENGISKTDLVSLEPGDQLFRLTALIALMSMGVCVVNSSAETTALAAEQGAGIFLCDDQYAPPAQSLPANARIVRISERWFRASTQDFIKAEMGFGRSDQPYEPGLPALVFFTSGTTGMPKALAMSYAQFNMKLASKRGFFDQFEGDRVLIIPDMVSSLGLTSAFAALMLGRTIFLIKTVHVPKAVGLYKIELIIASTYLMHVLVNILQETPFDFSSVLGVRFGGGSASQQLLNQVAILITPNISFEYASTEAGPTAILPLPVARAYPGLTGLPAPGARIKILDERGVEVAAGETGEIFIRTEQMALPFVSRTHSVEPPTDHWARPGDLGFIDGDGNLILTGRTSDLINVGGIKFLPNIVEDFLMKQPGISDAAAVSVPPRNGMIEELHLFIVSKTRNQSELASDLHDKLGLARPHKLHLVDAIPRNRLGKIARAQLRDLATLD